MTSRDLARAVLERVDRDGAYANRALAVALDRAPTMSAEDRGLATELVYGVLRRQARLDRAIAALAPRGLAALDPRVRIALRLAAYQILFLDRVPAYAAVDDGVEACKRVGGRGVAGFANALLRKLGRVGEPALPDPAVDPQGYLTTAVGMPPWMAALVLAELPPAEAIAFGDSIASPAPVTLRANTPRASREALVARLSAERPGATLTLSPLSPDTIEAQRLDAPAATAAWREGLFAIQDAGAQLVAELCGAAPGERILDACAGNGGKTAHLLALAGGRARVDAVDINAPKLSEAERTLGRLGLGGATFATADLTLPLPDPGARYDRICSTPPAAAWACCAATRRRWRGAGPTISRRWPRASSGC